MFVQIEGKNIRGKYTREIINTKNISRIRLEQRDESEGKMCLLTLVPLVGEPSSFLYDNEKEAKYAMSEFMIMTQKKRKRVVYE